MARRTDADDDLGEAMARVRAYLRQIPRTAWHADPSKFSAGRALLDAGPEERIALALAATRLCGDEHEVGGSRLFRPLDTLRCRLLRKAAPYAGPDLERLAEALHREAKCRMTNDFDLATLKPFETAATDGPLPEPVVARLIGLRRALDEGFPSAARSRYLARLEALAGVADPLRLARGAPWADLAIDELGALPPAERRPWHALIDHCAASTGSKPSKKWLGAAVERLDAIGRAPALERIARWFAASAVPKPSEFNDWRPPDEPNDTILKGLAWSVGTLDAPDAARALHDLALVAFQKAAIPAAVGNAALLGLGNLPGPEGLNQLALLKVRLKKRSIQAQIVKAIGLAADRLGLSADELEEIGVPDYGLTAVGHLDRPIGGFTARLTVETDGTTRLDWPGPDGKAQKSVPAAVKSGHADELKRLKATAKEVGKMLTAQRERIDGFFLQQRSWPLADWRARYLDHRLVGILARRLLWRFTTEGEAVDGAWLDGRLVGLDDRPIEGLDPGATVEPWHPIGRPIGEVVAWREWLERHRVRQPFKQAHREVYLLTDAERRTRTYSNRFAAHLVRQHQFHALCAARGWKNQLRLMVDAGYDPPSKELPNWGLRAEFWVEEAGDEWGRDTNDTGTYLYLSTDQVRFYRLGDARAGRRRAAGEPVPLEEVPPLVFSEVMRDVDLFVGVASVGNDPTWADGGRTGHQRDAWTRFAFGDLSATATTRKEALERIVPRLKVADRCSFADRFLVVRGDLRTYKIHLGSGNVLMEPNDQYLCIVPKAASGRDASFLPFEGDGLLSVILSKALLLAADAAITDPTIVSQIRGR